MLNTEKVPTLQQVKSAMRWWNGMSNDNKTTYRAVHYLIDATQITRYWIKEFPALALSGEKILSEKCLDNSAEYLNGYQDGVSASKTSEVVNKKTFVDLAKLLRAKREELGLSRQELADKLEVPQNGIADMERGNTHNKRLEVRIVEPRLVTRSVARFFQVEVEEHRNALVEGSQHEQLTKV